MINNVNLEYNDSFIDLGLLVNSNFNNVYKLKELIDSLYDYVFGYFINNQLVGFIHVSKLYETLDVVNIVINPDFRNKGIATSLLDYSINYFEDIESVMLEVNEKNIAAISLYEKNNFKVINKRNNYYGSDAALIMKRDV
jgi:ribosomal protein S18 acetylase RimI-like enzyme